MLPLKRDIPLAVVHCFKGLRGEARERALATGNYDEIAQQQAQQPEREPGQDDEQREHRTAFDTIDDEVPA